MKNLKKVLALVLAFACAFTMFAGAVVYPDVPAGSEYSEAITMLSDLGIIQGKDDGKYHSEDTITRAEACALIARMLTGDPQVSQYAGASNFTDVVKGSWKESVVGYCVVNGITVGVGNNKFEPDRAITDAEFVTMVVRAMGYETTGTSYPYGHISAAQANGLLDDVTVVPSSAALRGEDAQIIYNALFADYARGAKQINTTHGTTVEEYPTIAEDVFGLKRAAAGTVKDGELDKCKAHTWVIDEVFKNDDGTSELWAYAIEDDKTTLYDLDKDATWAIFDYDGDASAMVGYQVELWGEGQHGKEEYETRKIENEKVKLVAYDWDIKAIKTVKGQTAYDYNATMADSKVDGTLKFDGNELDVDSENYTKHGYAVRYLNKTIKANDVEATLNLKNSAQYKLIDWDSDDQIDFIDVDYTFYYKIDSITSKKLKMTDFDGCTVTLDLDNGAIDHDVNSWATIKGELPADLEKDDIIALTGEVVWNKKDEATITLTIKVVEPETKELTDVDSKGKAWFDDEKIEVADSKKINNTTTWYYYFKSNDTAKWYDDLDEGDEDTSYDLYRDANGYIIFAEEADETSKGYIFVTGLENGADKTGNRNLMQISGRLDDNSKLEDAKVAKDATIKLYNADKKDYLEDIDFDKNAVTNAQAKAIIGRVFKYSVNDDDQITKLTEVAIPMVSNNTAYTFTDKTDKLVVDTAEVNSTINAQYIAAGKQNVWLDDCDVIFAVKTNGNVNTVNFGNLNVDFDLDDVMAVQVEDLPDIAKNGEKTVAKGVHFSKPDSKSRVETVVLGVDTFRYFANSSTAVGLVTYVKYSTKTEKFTVTASIPGKEGTSFTTIDTDDLSKESVKSIKELQTLLDTKKGVFCEFEFNTDGEITEMLQMNTSVNNKAYANQIDGKNGTYTVARIVIDHVSNKSSDDTLTGMAAVSSGSKIYTLTTAADTDLDFELKDSTEYYVIGKDLKMTESNVLNAYEDGFDKNFDIDEIEEAKKSDLVSFFDSVDDDDDEYVVADVVLDGKKVVAVYYYEEPVGETNDVAYAPTATLKADNQVQTDDEGAAQVIRISADASQKARANGSVELTVGGTTVRDTVAIDDSTMQTLQDLEAAINASSLKNDFKVTYENANLVLTANEKKKGVEVSFRQTAFDPNHLKMGDTQVAGRDPVKAHAGQKATLTFTAANKATKSYTLTLTATGAVTGTWSQPITLGDANKFMTAAEVAEQASEQIDDTFGTANGYTMTVVGNTVVLVRNDAYTGNLTFTLA